VKNVVLLAPPVYCVEQGLCNGTVSVCPIRPLQQHAAGLLLWAQLAGDIDRLLHVWCRSSTEPRQCMQQEMRAVPLLELT